VADMQSTSSCLLRLPDGRLVFQRRTKDAPVSPLMLSLFGGHIESHEKALHALRREVSEETSLDIKHLHVRHMGTYRQKDADGLMNLYVVDIKSPEFQVYEGLRQESYRLDEALTRDDLHPNTRYILEMYQDLGGR
jgi:8-oxo-dGTP pyrophosphatase MutT (NUDIX family)